MVVIAQDKQVLMFTSCAKMITVRDQARYNMPRQPYTCLPGNFGLVIVYDLDDAICQLGIFGLSINRVERFGDSLLGLFYLVTGEYYNDISSKGKLSLVETRLH